MQRLTLNNIATSMRLIVNIPAWNEEKTIATVIPKNSRSNRGIDEVKVQVIDDDLPTKTVEISKTGWCGFPLWAMCATWYRRGFSKTASNHHGGWCDIMVNIGCDGQFPAGDIPKIHGFDRCRPKRTWWWLLRFGIKSAKNMLGSKVPQSLRGVDHWKIFALSESMISLAAFRRFPRDRCCVSNLAIASLIPQETIIDAISKNLVVKWIPGRSEYFDESKIKKLWKLVGKFVLPVILIIIRTVRDARPMVFFWYFRALLWSQTAFAIGMPFWDTIFSHFRSRLSELGFLWLWYCFWSGSTTRVSLLLIGSATTENSWRTDVFFEKREIHKWKFFLFPTPIPLVWGRSWKPKTIILRKISKKIADVKVVLMGKAKNTCLFFCRWRFFKMLFLMRDYDACLLGNGVWPLGGIAKIFIAKKILASCTVSTSLLPSKKGFLSENIQKYKCPLSQNR